MNMTDACNEKMANHYFYMIAKEIADLIHISYIGHHLSNWKPMSAHEHFIIHGMQISLPKR